MRTKSYTELVQDEIWLHGGVTINPETYKAVEAEEGFMVSISEAIIIDKESDITRELLQTVIEDAVNNNCYVGFWKNPENKR